MTSGNEILFSVSEDDLITPTSAAKYPVGTEVQVSNGSTSTTYIYAKAHTTLTAYQPYVLDLSIYGAITSAPLTLAAPGAIVVVPQVAFTTAFYGWMAKKGLCSALHISQTYAAGDMLQLLSGGAALVVDGTTAQTVKSVNTCGVTITAGSTAAAFSIMLNGEQAVVAAT